MKFVKLLPFRAMSGSVLLACAIASIPSSVHANVYATDIKVAGVLTNGPVAVPLGGSTAISYILNEAASNGISINILDSNSTVIDTIGVASPAAGTLRGRNSVAWGGTNSSGAAVDVGNYYVTVTAATRGYTVWTQTSIDTNSGAPAYFPQGIDVDKNTNSPYYGRVIVGCALNDTGNVNAAIPAFARLAGLYKMNADGTYADEGGYGNAGYTTDMFGDVSTNAGMPTTSKAAGLNPLKIRVADDDRIYWCDDSDRKGAILACDMLATTNQIVINSGTSASFFSVPNNYSTCDDLSDLSAAGIEEFDVLSASTTNASIYLCDNDFPNWGIWMFHLTNGASDPNDTEGTQTVFAGSGSSLALVSSGGCMVDTNLDVFVDQNRNNNGDATFRAMVFSNWNGGILPPDNSGFNFSLETASWAVGGADNTMQQGRDIAINSRTAPTIVAYPMANGASYVSGKTGAGIRLLNVADGSVVTVTNGAVVTTYTNLDVGEIYTCAAWDNVGNLYAASTQRNLWRVWSPPGGSTNTTMAAEIMSVQPLPATASLAATTFSANADTNSVPLTATYTGTAPVTLTWYLIDGNNITNVAVGTISNTLTTSTLILTSVQDSQNGYKYFLVASNALGGTNTTTATLTVVNPTASLAATTFSGNANGNATTITITTNGTLAPSIQWYSIDTSNPPNTNAVVGQTNATLALTGLLASQNGYKYFAVASWPYAPSVTTSSATLTVFNLPAITTQVTPLLEYVPTGFADSFTVAATGAIPLSYQWYNDGVAISGATTNKYSFNATNGTHNYYVNVANSVNPAGVNSATATVVAPLTALSFSSTVGSNSATGWSLNGGPTFVSPGVLQLTTAVTSQARSAFYSLTRLPVDGFVASFTYTPSGGTATRADGVTFCLSGANAATNIGGGGGSLGVAGISPSVELELNIYTGAAGGIGISYSTNGVITPAGPTGSVNINSLDPINVTVVYNHANTFVYLVDTVTAATYSTNYSGTPANDITNVLGTNVAWVGFTGATGGSDAVQNISNFLFQNISNAMLAPGSLTSGTLPFTWNVAGLTLQQSLSVAGPWSNVTGTVTTNYVTGQAQMTVTPAGPAEFFRLFAP